jgi:peptide/nickel transport system substrate-binding protein
MPVLSPWIPISSDSQRQQYERNPYYFKVDTEGNQLPYIDAMTVEYTSNAEVMNLKAVSGELSVAGLDIQLLNYPIIRRGEEAGGYTTKLVYSERGSDVSIALNPLHPDPVLAELFSDVRFRQALSLGIDREEINELVFLGQGTPRQATINETASFFDPAWASHYAEHDVGAANALLDELGLDQRNGQGVRLRRDGVPLSFQLEYLPQEGPKKEVCELVVKHWQELGLQVDAAARERGYLIQRLDAQEQHATAWHVDRVLERPAYAYSLDGKLGPGGNSITRYAREWQNWFNSDGARGVEPPQDAKELRQAYVDWQKTSMGTPEYEAAAKKVFDLTAETLYVIGTVGQAPQPVIVRNDVGNVFKADDDTRLWWGAANWFWHTLQPEQWFIKT